jgi:uncharacterized membrane protein SirB2
MGEAGMDYLLLKQVHVACAVLSYAGFFVRGVWMMRDSALLERRWVRILPHVNDTLLLASAIALAALSRQYPFVHGWLTAKVLALVLYVVLGMAALRTGRARRSRIAAWLAAQAVFLYIVWVAMARNPAPWTG